MTSSSVPVPGAGHRFALALLLLAACHAAGGVGLQPPSPLWGGLESGRYRVGLSLLFERDTTRPALGPDSAPPPGRPMQIVVWYPAGAAGDRPVTLRQYIELSAGALGPDSATAERRRRLVEGFASEPRSNGIAQSAVDSLLGTPMGAVVDAPPAGGRFPLLVFLHASPWGASVMSEYLASHGFVVAAIESKGAREAPYRLSRANLDAMVRDAGFTVTRMRREPFVGELLGIIGMSNGAIAAVALQLGGIVPQAVVSLDGGIGEQAGGSYLGSVSGAVATRFTVPLLHLYTPDNRYLDFQYLRSYQAAPRTM
ncbi:MAG TPA: hypothetical protein VGA78_06190, partial [Gemmatimonadales bacterium]